MRSLGCSRNESNSESHHIPRRKAMHADFLTDKAEKVQSNKCIYQRLHSWPAQSSYTELSTPSHQVHLSNSLSTTKSFSSQLSIAIQKKRIEKMSPPLAMSHFPSAQTTFQPPLVANNNAFLGDIVSSTDTSAPISAGFFRLEKGRSSPLPLPYHPLPLSSPLTRFRHPIGIHLHLPRNKNNPLRLLQHHRRNGQESRRKTRRRILFPQRSDDYV